jgi:hypothetical protein
MIQNSLVWHDFYKQLNSIRVTTPVLFLCLDFWKKTGSIWELITFKLFLEAFFPWASKDCKVPFKNQSSLTASTQLIINRLWKHEKCFFCCRYDKVARICCGEILWQSYCCINGTKNGVPIIFFLFPRIKILWSFYFFETPVLAQ